MYIWSSQAQTRAGLAALAVTTQRPRVEATGEGTVLRGDIGGVGGQRGQGLPVGEVVDVGHVPAETDAVPAGFALGDIGGPFLREALGVDQVFGVQFVQPLDAVPVASCAAAQITLRSLVTAMWRPLSMSP